MNGDHPQKLGKYDIIEHISTGGMANLYKAAMTGAEGFEKTVALKIILPELRSNISLVRSFINEAKLAAGLNHPNIVRIYDFGKASGSYYIAMEYLEGENLQTVMGGFSSMQKSMGLNAILYIIKSVLTGLDYAHNLSDNEGKPLKLVHNDISPQNIFLTNDGQVKILDFGIARAAVLGKTGQNKGLRGKASYISPEQARGRPVDSRSDIFSAGVLLYEMIAQVKLFSGDDASVLAQIREAKIEPLESTAPGLPHRLYSIARSALAPDPDMRYLSADQMISNLDDCITHSRLNTTQKDMAELMTTLKVEGFRQSGRLVSGEAGSINLEPTRLLSGDEINAAMNMVRQPDSASVAAASSTVKNLPKPEIRLHGGAANFGGRKKIPWLYIIPALLLICGLCLFLFWPESPEKPQISKKQLTQKEMVLKAAGFINAGDEYLKKGMTDKALLEYEKAVSVDPFGSSEAWRKKGDILFQKGDLKNALKDMENAVFISSNDINALRSLGQIQTRLGNLDKAINAFGKIISINPDLSWAYVGRGVAYEKLQYADRALNDFDEALLVDKNNSEAYFEKGCLFLNRGEPGKATEFLKKSIQIEPKAIYCFYNGIALEKSGEQAFAMENYDKAIALEPYNPVFLNKRGELLYKWGRLGQAKEDFLVAIKSKPNYSKSWLNLAFAQKKSGNLDDALISVNNAIKLSPKNSTAIKLKNQISKALNK